MARGVGSELDAGALISREGVNGSTPGVNGS
jgi:hypothetical protein